MDRTVIKKRIHEMVKTRMDIYANTNIDLNYYYPDQLEYKWERYYNNPKHWVYMLAPKNYGNESRMNEYKNIYTNIIKEIKYIYPNEYHSSF